jgi:signal peptidase II
MEAVSERDASTRAVLVLAGTAIFLLVADQVTKALVVANVPVGARYDVVGDLAQIWHVHNTGAAFSILPGATWLFVPVTVIAIGMVGYFHRALRDHGLWVQVILGAILAGALGNLADRARQGAVIDFIDPVAWPAFNVADACIVIGVFLLLWVVEGRPKRARKS